MQLPTPKKVDWSDERLVLRTTSIASVIGGAAIAVQPLMMSRFQIIGCLAVTLFSVCFVLSAYTLHRPNNPWKRLLSMVEPSNSELIAAARELFEQKVLSRSLAIYFSAIIAAWALSLLLGIARFGGLYAALNIALLTSSLLPASSVILLLTTTRSNVLFGLGERVKSPSLTETIDFQPRNESILPESNLRQPTVRRSGGRQVRSENLATGKVAGSQPVVSEKEPHALRRIVPQFLLAQYPYASAYCGFLLFCLMSSFLPAGLGASVAGWLQGAAREANLAPVR